MIGFIAGCLPHPNPSPQKGGECWRPCSLSIFHCPFYIPHCPRLRLSERRVMFASAFPSGSRLDRRSLSILHCPFYIPHCPLKEGQGGGSYSIPLSGSSLLPSPFWLGLGLSFSPSSMSSLSSTLPSSALATCLTILPLRS